MPLYPDFNRLYQPAEPTAGQTRWLPLRGREFLVRADGERVALIEGLPEALAHAEPIVLGESEGVLYMTCELTPDFGMPEAWRAIDLRRLYGRIDEQEWMLQCAHCEHIRYPQVSPAVLILVHDSADRVLLSHQPGWGEMHSILAGFVLPGESLEECVHREVEEEVGVTISDLVYEGSQPWPFPQQLMIGFSARHVGGDIRIDEQELDHAAWYDVRELPAIPPKLSLSRRMIDAWAEGRDK